MIKFFYIINKQGVVRLNRYYQHREIKERYLWQATVIKNVIERSEKQCNLFELKGETIVYRKFVSLYVIAGISEEENELAILELMQNFIETLDQYFQNLSEVDIVFNTEKVYMILDEMVVNGYVAETSRMRALIPLQLLDAAKK